MALQEREQKMIGVLIILALGYGGYFVFTSVKPKYDKMKSETDELRKKFRIAERGARKLSQLEKKRKDINEKLELAKEKLPTEKDVKAIYNEFTVLLTKSRIRADQVQSISSGSQREESFYIIQPYSISLGCSFESLCLLLNELYNYPRLLDVVNLPLSISINGKKNVDVKIALVINTYLYREGTEPEE